MTGTSEKCPQQDYLASVQGAVYTGLSEERVGREGGSTAILPSCFGNFSLQAKDKKGEIILKPEAQSVRQTITSPTEESAEEQTNETKRFL